MKCTFSILWFLLLSFIPRAQYYQQFAPTPQQRLDSLEVLASFDGVVCGYGATLKDTVLNRYAEITNYVYNLTYKESRNLMTSQNNIKKAHGFINALRKYTDDITPDMDIFRSKDSIKVYNRKAIKFEKMTLGNFCSLLYNEKIEMDSLNKVSMKTYVAVNNFIINNAKYPKTFVIDNTFYFEENDSIPFFGYTLSYSLSDNKGNLVNEKRNFFILDKNQEIQFVIKPKNKLYIISEDLKKKWLLKYGK